MGCCWRMWPCMPCFSVRASLTPTRPGGASTVGESQPTSEDPPRVASLAGVWRWEGAQLVREDGQGKGAVPGLTRSPAHSPPPPSGKSSVPRRRANTSSLQRLCPVNSAPFSEVRPRPCPFGPPPGLTPRPEPLPAVPHPSGHRGGMPLVVAASRLGAPRKTDKASRGKGVRGQRGKKGQVWAK